MSNLEGTQPPHPDHWPTFLGEVEKQGGEDLGGGTEVQQEQQELLQSSGNIELAESEEGGNQGDPEDPN